MSKQTIAALGDIPITIAALGDIPITQAIWGRTVKPSTRQRIVAVRWGTIPVTKAILGLTTVMRVAAAYDSFNRTDRYLDDDGRWVNYGPATTHRAAIENGIVRAAIEDTATDTIDAISHMRYAGGRAPSDDGYIQCRAFSGGDTNGLTTYTTAIYGRLNDNCTEGIALQLVGNTIRLAVRADSTDTTVATFGDFSANDIIRVVYTGSDYTVLCNSQRRGTWTDRLGQVTADEQHRSIGVRVHGAKNSSGPRFFSPAIDSIEMG